MGTHPKGVEHSLCFETSAAGYARGYLHEVIKSESEHIFIISKAMTPLVVIAMIAVLYMIPEEMAKRSFYKRVMF